jgi:hypothetical protein
MEAILLGIAFLIFLTGVLQLAAIDDLNNNLAQLKTDVEAYIASKTGAVPAAQVEAAAQAVAALDAEVKAAP